MANMTGSPRAAAVTTWEARRLVWGGLVCGSLVWACTAIGCDTEPEAEITPPTPRDLLADELAATLCDGAANCCSELGFDKPGESCRSSMRNAVMASIITAEDQLRELLPEEHEGCIAAFEAAIDEAPSCDLLPAPFELEGRCPSLFTPIPEGAGQPGDVCAGTFECASPSQPGTRSCVPVGNGSSRCVWYLDRAQGEPCSASDGSIPVCAEGLACAPDAMGTPVCGAPPEPGNACVEGIDTCTPGYVCAPNTVDELQCFPEIQLGKDCSMQPAACAKGLFCAVTGSCKMLPDPCAAGGCPALILQNVCR